LRHPLAASVSQWPLGARLAAPDGATLRTCNSKAKGLWSNVCLCPILARGPYL
jgi:hypothetical protein